MVVIRLFSCIFLLLSVPALSAQLFLTVTNQHGEVISKAVAALVPTQATDFTAVPPAIMDQRDNMFVPSVLAIRVNTLVRFPNSDDVRHHVYSFSPAKKFELRLYHGMTAEPVLFDQPGTVVLGCNIHDSMVAYIYVVETDFFALSDKQGNIQLNAPAGEYQLQMYHPQMQENFPASRIVLGDTTKQQTIVLNNLSPPTATEPTDEFSDLF
jgi:plastocyanin